MADTRPPTVSETPSQPVRRRSAPPRLLIGPGLTGEADRVAEVAAGHGLESARVADPPRQPGTGLVLVAWEDPSASAAFLAGTAAGWVPVVVLGGSASAEQVRAAYRAGAVEVLFAGEGGVAGELDTLLGRLYGGGEPAAGGERSHFRGLVGASPPMVELYWLIEAVAPTDTTVLLRGESGTGKGLAARAIHAESPRAESPFVAINCGAIPADLLEAELFGHVQGAFAGAVRDRRGRFALAEGGTLFLDEIAELGPDLQVKLLRALEEGAFEPVGTPHSVPFDARVVAAANTGLERAVAEGRFREDLYHRLNVVGLDLPPLRERGSQDIFTLLDHFLEQFNHRHGARVSGVDPLCRSLLAGYEWPGNVREVRNLAERLAILKGQGTVEAGDLPERIRGVRPSAPGGEADDLERDVLLGQARDLKAEVEAFENRLILQALEATEGNRNQAAQLLGVKRTTLVEKLKKRGLG